MKTELWRNRLAALILVALVSAGGEVSQVRAAELSPETETAHELVSEMIDLVLAELSKKEVEKEVKIKALESIVSEKFDFATIARLVLAKNYKRFDEDQRRDFEANFKHYLSRFYGSRLVDYADENVEVKGARLEKRGDVTVMTKIIGGDVDGIEMNYRVRNRNDAWRVIDVTIEGVSTVSNFRAQFREIISQGGPEELLKTLRNKTHVDVDADAKEGA